MTALPHNQYSTTFSLDGVGSPASPSRGGRHLPATFRPTPITAFTVVVSIVPADQLTSRQTSTMAPANAANLAVEGLGGAAGVGGPSSMASSIPANMSVVAPPSSPGFLLNSSFNPANSSFALTKSFGDVFTLKKASGQSSNALMASSGRSNNSLGSTSSAAAAAAAAVRGLADPSVSETPVPSSQDSYRVHLLLPADHPKNTNSTGSGDASHQQHHHHHHHHHVGSNGSLTAASPTLANLSSRPQVSLYSSADPNANSGGNGEEDGLSAATSSLEALRSAKRKQAAQVNEHWVLFQQLVRFVLSVAPRFEPPPTPPGFAFPVDLGLSFVQNSSIFCAAETTQQMAKGVGGVGGGNLNSTINTSSTNNNNNNNSSSGGGGAGGLMSSSARLSGLPTGSFSSPANAAKSTKEDPLVRGEEREARRAYMESYLNAAIQCEQVNCLKELQAFVGYDTYVKNELARFRVMSRSPSNGSMTGSPATGFPTGLQSNSMNNNNNNNSGSQFLMKGNGSRSDFSNRGPLASSSQSTSSRSQYTVSTTSSTSPRAGSNVGAPTSAALAAAQANSSGGGGGMHHAVSGSNHARVPSSRTSDVAAPPNTSTTTTTGAGARTAVAVEEGGFSVSPPVLARSLPPSNPSSLHPLDDPSRSALLTAAGPALAEAGAAVGASGNGSPRGGVVEVIDYTGRRVPLAGSGPSATAVPSSFLSDQTQLPPFALKTGPSSKAGSTAGASLISANSGRADGPMSAHGNGNGGRLLSENASAFAASVAASAHGSSPPGQTGKPLATSQSSSGSNHLPSPQHQQHHAHHQHPLAASVHPHTSSHSPSTSASLLLGAVEVDGERSNKNNDHNRHSHRRHHDRHDHRRRDTQRSNRHRHDSVHRGSTVDDGAESMSSSSSSTSSSVSVDSSFGSSVSHPGSARRRTHRHQYQRPADEADRDVRRRRKGKTDSPQQHPEDRKGSRRSRGGRGGEEGAVVEGDGEEAATAATVLAEEQQHQQPNPALSVAVSGIARSDLKSLVAMAPETERMLTECFRMMDTAGCGYVSAADCLPFYCCATSESFAETLHLYTNAASLAEEAASGAEVVARQAELQAQLTALLPAWVRDCESVVVDSPDYLMSCARFVDAVREMLAVSAAIELSSAAAAATAGAASTAVTTTSGNGGACLNSRGQTSAHDTRASSAVLGASSGSNNSGVNMNINNSFNTSGGGGGGGASRDGRRNLDGSPLPLRLLDTTGDGGHHPGPGPASWEEGSASPAAAAAMAAAGATAPIASLESWIDNYWLLMYSHLFTAIAALVVGAEAAGLRAALLEVREKAYLEMTAQVATAVAAASEARQTQRQSPAAQEEAVAATASTEHATAPADRPAIHNTNNHLMRNGSSGSPMTPSLELVYPPWLLREVAAALAAQPPLLGCFDALELLSLVYIISESGVAVVGVEDVLQWLGTRTCQPNTRFSLDEFASMLDVLSCSLPFVDVLHCVKRQWTFSITEADGEGSGKEKKDDRAGHRAVAEALASTPLRDQAIASRQQHAHLLRLISRCATADPSGGREFNELVQEQRWRRGSVTDSSGRTCGQCQLAHGVLKQQAVLLETLSAENLALQQRIAELEAAAGCTAAGADRQNGSVGSEIRKLSDEAERADTGDHEVAPSPPSGALDNAAAATDSALPNPICDDTQRQQQQQPQQQMLGGDALINPHSAASPTSLPLPSPLPEKKEAAAATAAEATPSADVAQPKTRRTTLELVPVFTDEVDDSAAREHGGDSDDSDTNNRNAANFDGHNTKARGHHRTSRQSRAAATQVARAGPLLYTVPEKYAPRQPSELEWTFYLCRAGQREEGEGDAKAGVVATGAGVNSGGTVLRMTGGGGGVPGSGSMNNNNNIGGGPAAPTVERMTVRDGAGHRVVAFKLSNNVLHILGRDNTQRPPRLPLVTSPRSPKNHHGYLYGHRSLHGGASPFALSTSPPRHSPPRHTQERRNVNSLLGREQNILYPSYEDSDWDGGDNPYSFLHGGREWNGSAANPAPHGNGSYYNFSTAPYSGSGNPHAGASNDRSGGGGGHVTPTIAAASLTTMASATTAADLDDAQAQRVVSRVVLQAHEWYTLKLRMNWAERTVEVTVTRTATAPAKANTPHRGSSGDVRHVYEGTVRMLDAGEVTGLNSVEVFPRREMLVAYCNMLVRYEAS